MPVEKRDPSWGMGPAITYRNRSGEKEQQVTNEDYHTVTNRNTGYMAYPSTYTLYVGMRGRRT